MQKIVVLLISMLCVLPCLITKENSFIENYKRPRYGLILNNYSFEIHSSSHYEKLQHDLQRLYNSENQSHLVVAASQLNPFIILRPENGNQYLGGFGGEIFQTIAHYTGLNYKYHIIPQKGLKFGSLKNGSWNGVIRFLVDRKVEAVIIPMGKTPDRIKAVQFSLPIIFNTKTIILKTEDATVYNYDIFFYLRPFSTAVWLIFLILVSFGKGVFWVCTNKDELLVKRLEKQNFSKEVEYKNHRSSAVGIPAIIAHMSCYFLVIVFWSMYTSTLIATISTSRTERMETVEDVLKQENFRIGVTKNTKTVQSIRSSQYGILASLWKRISKHPDNLVSIKDEGIRKVKNEKQFGFIIDTFVGEHYIKDDCNLMLLRENFFPTNLYFTFPMEFEFVELFNQYISRMRATGILHRIRSNLTGNTRSICDRTFHMQTAGIKETWSAFMVLAIGIFSALIALATEILIEKLLFLPKNSEVVK